MVWYLSFVVVLAVAASLPAELGTVDPRPAEAESVKMLDSTILAQVNLGKILMVTAVRGDGGLPYGWISGSLIEKFEEYGKLSIPVTKDLSDSGSHGLQAIGNVVRFGPSLCQVLVEVFHPAVQEVQKQRLLAWEVVVKSPFADPRLGAYFGYTGGIVAVSGKALFRCVEDAFSCFFASCLYRHLLNRPVGMKILWKARIVKQGAWRRSSSHRGQMRLPCPV